MFSHFSVPKITSLAILTAGLLALPLFGNAQISEPTSSIQLPTSSIGSPFNEPQPNSSPEEPPQIFGSQLPYPYPGPTFGPGLSRAVYAIALAFMLSGVLLVGASFGRSFEKSRSKRGIG